MRGAVVADDGAQSPESAASPMPHALSSAIRPTDLHAFRAVWVSGLADADARKGLFGRQFADLRTIRVNAARHRFRPSHARVVQGAVRGAPDGDAAWQAFEQAMLRDLAFEQRM